MIYKREKIYKFVTTLMWLICLDWSKRGIIPTWKIILENLLGTTYLMKDVEYIVSWIFIFHQTIFNIATLWLSIALRNKMSQFQKSLLVNSTRETFFKEPCGWNITHLTVVKENTDCHSTRLFKYKVYLTDGCIPLRAIGIEHDELKSFL